MSHLNLDHIMHYFPEWKNKLDEDLTCSQALFQKWENEHYISLERISLFLGLILLKHSRIDCMGKQKLPILYPWILISCRLIVCNLILCILNCLQHWQWWLLSFLKIYGNQQGFDRYHEHLVPKMTILEP